MTIRTFNNITPSIDPSVYVDDMCLVLGDVHIGADSSIWPMVTIRGDVHQIRIGARTSIQDNSVIHITHDGKYNPGGFPTIVGDDVTIGHKVTLHGCTIGNNCIIGMDSTILDGAIIEENVILGAGSLVSPGKVLESGYLWLGRPAQKKRKLSDDDIESIKYSANHYVKLKNQHIELE